MISVQEAEAIVRAHGLIWGAEMAPVRSGRRLAESLRADRAYPPFDRATMDGICVNWEVYLAGARAFEITGVAAAGQPRAQLPHPAVASEIMTGAPLPEGADLVIPYEDLKIEGQKAEVTSKAERAQFENVHKKGSDCAAGAEIVPAGFALNGPRAGIAASFGYQSLQMQKRPRIKIISTGDELVGPGATPLEHQIRGSNAVALKASLELFGYAEVDLDHVIDEPALLDKNYLDSAEAYDVLIYTGGVSKGKFDYLPQVWQNAGVEKHFHQVSQRPGKPLWFGTDQKRQTTVFGLPGNPVSCLVCLHRYFLDQKPCYARLANEVQFGKDLTLFLPVKIEWREDGTVNAYPLKIQNSGEFTALAESDGFVELPRGGKVFRAGEPFRYFSWRPL